MQHMFDCCSCWRLRGAVGPDQYGLCHLMPEANFSPPAFALSPIDGESSNPPELSPAAQLHSLPPVVSLSRVSSSSLRSLFPGLFLLRIQPGHSGHTSCGATMNTRQVIDESVGPYSLSATFNNDSSCFSVGLDTGFCGMARADCLFYACLKLGSENRG